MYLNENFLKKLKSVHINLELGSRNSNLKFTNLFGRTYRIVRIFFVEKEIFTLRATFQIFHTLKVQSNSGFAESGKTPCEIEHNFLF